ncbi:MAG TPA: 6-bladed beta-propeller [Actinomycetota bacterium]|nr:6-bladed beta-propeller [Actinomycetota bacterium]
MPSTSRHRSIVHALAACLIAALLTPVIATVAAPVAGAQAWSPPGYVRSFGGRGEAGDYPWGMAYNPVTDQVISGDYWNFWARRWNPDTGASEGQFFRPVNQRRGQPYSISIDDRQGDFYIAEISSGDIGYFTRYSANGTFIEEFDSDARYNAWHTISDGRLYVADSHYWNNAGSPSKVRVYDLDDPEFDQILSFGTWGTTPNTGQMGNIHGIAVDAGGRIYVADGTNRRVHVFTSSGTFLYDVGSPGSGVGQFSGDLRGMAIDQTSGAIYVVDANQGQIEKFQMSANPATTPPTAVAHWGSEGTGPGQMGDGGRGITVDGDGNVWVADYGNYRMLKYSPSGTVLGTYPDPAQPPPPGGFSWARDVAIDPQGDVWGADARNNRFQQFSSSGAFLGTWGRRQSNPPYGMDYPRGIGVNPANGDVWVASTRDHFLRVYDSAVNYIGTVGNGVDSSGTGSFRWPLDVEFATAGATDYAWISDYTSGRVKRVDAVPPFTERQSISVTNNGIALDEAADRLYVLSWQNDDVRIYNASAGSYITRFGSRGTGTCQFQNPWDIDLVNGVLYVTDSVRNKVMAFSTSGACLGEWGSKGQGPYQFKDPSGITHDAQGNLYIADANNDRITMYSFSVPVPNGSDTTLPTVSLTSPTAGQVLAPSTVTLAGAAGDNVGIASVFTSVRDRSTNKWWNANDAIWGATRTWNYAAVNAPTPTGGTYTSSFISVRYGGLYQAQSKVTDTTGNMKLSGQVNFSVGTGGPQDNVAPTLTVSQPSKDSTVPAGSVNIAGHANDNAGVATVEIAIRNRVTLQWWQPGTGTWGANLKWFSVALGSPGATSTTWSAPWNDAVPGGSYRVQGRAIDTSGNMVPTPYPFTQFLTS